MLPSAPLCLFSLVSLLAFSAVALASGTATPARGFPTERPSDPPAWSMPAHSHTTLHSSGAHAATPPEKINPHAAPAFTPLSASNSLALSATASSASESLADYPVEIQNIVRATGSDPRKIFDLIRNHVRFQPYQGFRKSPELVWLTRSGNDADQAHLLQQCLEAAGLEAFFEYGVVFLPSAQVRAWFGADNIQALQNIAGSSGYVGGYDSINDLYGLEQIWCNVVVGQDVFRLHPAYKTYTEEAGIDLAAAMNYDRAALLAAVGGTETANYVQGLSEPSAHAYLAARASELVNTLRTTHPNAEVDEIVSGRRIVPLALATDFTNGFLTPETIIDASGFDNFAFDDPYAAYTVGPTTYDFAAYLVVAVGETNASGTGLTTVLAEYGREAAFFAGKTITTAFGPDGHAAITVDGQLVALESTSPGANPIGVAYLIDHPYRNGADTLYDQLRVVPATRDGLYVWTFDPGGYDTPDVARRHRQRLEQFRRAGLAFDSPEIAAESLLLLGLDWCRQLTLATRLTAAHQRFVNIHHHTLALVKQEDGFGVDIPTTQVNLARDGDASASAALRHSILLIGSAMEHGVIEQNYPGLRAVSTVRYLRENNLDGGKTYLATAANYGNIYNDDDFYFNWAPAFTESVFPNAVFSGATLVIPESGFITLDALTGNGYLRYDANSISAIINPGNLKGGFATTPGFIDVRLNPTPLDPTTGPDSHNNPESKDPVDLLNGAFVFDHTDLALDGAGPRGLAFSRHYSSLASGTTAAPMGPGWSHGYESRIAVHTDTAAGLGGTTPVSAASLIAATYILSDLVEITPTAKTWLLAALTADWGVEQLRDNAATVTLGRRTLGFTRLADGTYSSPAGVTSTLVRDPVTDLFRIDERYGRTTHFDAENRLVQLIDADAKTLTLAYHPTGPDAGRLHTLTDAYARTLTLSYIGDRLTSVADSTRRTVHYAYTHGLLTSVTDPEGHARRFDYDAARRIWRTYNERDELVAENTYDAAGQISLQVAEDDPAQSWHYAFTGVLNTETNPDGQTLAHTFDPKGRVAAVTNNIGETEHRHYDGQDHLVRLIDSRGEHTRFVYDGRHNLRFVYDARNGPTGTDYVTEMIYDADDLLRFTLDPAGQQTELRYDAEFHLEKTIDPVGRETTYTYYSSGPHDGLLHTLTTPGALPGSTLTTTFTYDGNGYVDTIERPDDSLVEQTYNARGDLLALHITTPGDPNIHAVTYQYDANRRLLSVRDALNYGPATLYDPAGDPVETRDLHDNLTTSLFSPMGRLRQVTGPDRQTTVFTHDASGRPEAVANPLDQVTSTAYDDAGRPYLTTNALNHEVARAYDPRGALTLLTNARGHAHGFTYTPTGQVETHTTPLEREYRRTYDERDLLESSREPSLETTTYHYADDARLDHTIDPVGRIDYAYDAQGRLNLVTEGAQTLARTHDALGRVATFTDSAGHTLGYGHDGAGNRTRLTYPGGTDDVTYAYDTAGRLHTVTDWADRETSFAYDARSRLAAITYPNGTRRVFAYDAAGRVASMRDERLFPLAVLLEQSHRYDPLGRIEQEITTPEPVAYTALPALMTYDADDRLTGWSSGAASVVPAFDPDGNLTTGPLGGASATFVYDARNRLTGIAGGASYTYDAENRRTSKTEGGVTTTYIHDPHGGLSQLVQSTTAGVITRYVYAAGMLLYDETAGAIRVYHYDHRGSTLAMTDATGTVLGRASYGPYGEPVASTLPDTPFRYIGSLGVQTDSNGMLHMRARYYSPETRRFLNADPIGFGGGMNWYQYAGGNPVMNIDPSGHVPTAVVGAGVGALIGGGVAFFTSEGSYSDRFRAAGIGAIGGAVQGALVGSGAGLVTGLAVRGSVTATLATSAGINAGASAAGNVTQQMVSNLAQGQSWGDAAENISGPAVAQSATVGAAFGFVGGGLTSASVWVTSSVTAGRTTLGGQLTTVSADLIAQGATPAQVLGVQIQIMAGMSRLGQRTSNLQMGFAAADLVGLNASQEFTNSYIFSGSSQGGWRK